MPEIASKPGNHSVEAGILNESRLKLTPGGTSLVLTTGVIGITFLLSSPLQR